jgi:ATP diphosphatase
MKLMADTGQYQLSDLQRVMQRLRDPEHGCPWDLEQDFRSIAPSTLEEAHELVEAIEHNDFDHIPEELGDVLFQVIFYAQMGAEQGRFEFADIVHTLVEKLVRRHPHVFAEGEIEGVVEQQTSVADVNHSWESIKQIERDGRAQGGVLDDIPLALPALSRAQKIQKRVARVGFDWRSVAEVLEKVDEELAEFRAAQAESQARREEELGDLIFTCVNLARHEGIDAEAALRRATQKFESRFSAVEQSLAAAGESLADASLARMNELWEQAK